MVFDCIRDQLDSRDRRIAARALSTEPDSTREGAIVGAELGAEGPGAARLAFVDGSCSTRARAARTRIGPVVCLRRRYPAARHASEHHRLQPAGSKVRPQAGQAAVTSS